jgi:hypothetical protein
MKPTIAFQQHIYTALRAINDAVDAGDAGGAVGVLTLSSNPFFKTLASTLADMIESLVLTTEADDPFMLDLIMELGRAKEDPETPTPRVVQSHELLTWCVELVCHDKSTAKGWLLNVVKLRQLIGSQYEPTPDTVRHLTGVVGIWCESVAVHTFPVNRRCVSKESVPEWMMALLNVLTRDALVPFWITVFTHLVFHLTASSPVFLFLLSQLQGEPVFEAKLYELNEKVHLSRSGREMLFLATSAHYMHVLVDGDMAFMIRQLLQHRKMYETVKQQFFHPQEKPEIEQHEHEVEFDVDFDVDFADFDALFHE